MKKIALLFSFLIISEFCFADTTWVSDTVSGVWDSTGSPYILTGDCYVADGESLFIEEGVRIVSGDTSEVSIYGYYRLKIEGSPSFMVYITGVTINRPLRMQYCKVDSCNTGVFDPLYISFVEISDCYYGITQVSSVQFCNINNCHIGITVDWGYVLNVARTLFHHNYIGLSSACCIAGLFAKSNAYYCTFVDNDYSIDATHCSTYWESGTAGWWEHGYSDVRIYNSLICDEYFDRASANHNSPYIPDLGPEYYPAFVNPSLCDYRLDSLSLYIDMGDTNYGYPPDSFYGGNYDIGAFESPYTAPARCIFYQTDYDVGFPAVPFGDTSYTAIRIRNIGTAEADSIRVFIDSPFGFTGIIDSSLPVQTNNSITFSFLLDYITSSDTAILIWYLNDSSGSIKFLLNGYEIGPIIGAVSGTLNIDYSPYIFEDAYIPCGESLVIEPGVVIEGDLTAYGRLIADGTAVDSISFENSNLSFKTDTLCSPNSSCFSFCSFNNSIIIAIDTVSIKISNSRMTGNCRALDFRVKSSLWLEHSLINGFILQEESLLFISDSKVSIIDCEICDNTMQCHYVYNDPWSGHYVFAPLITIKYNSDILIDSCLFEDNSISCHTDPYHTWMNMIDLYIQSSYTTINNSLFRNNMANFLIYMGESYGISSECLFSNCVFQVNTLLHDSGPNMIYNIRSSVSFCNCSFIKSGIKNSLPTYTMVLNSLFFNSLFSGSSSDFHNCILPPGTIASDSSSVFFGTPTFVSDTSYMLAPTSIGIDMGAEFAVTDSGDTIWAPLTDFYGNPRPSGAGFDIGAAEYQWETYTANISCGIGWNLVSCPVADTVDITEIFPFTTGPAFSYDNFTGAYLDNYSMFPGFGYWALSSDSSSIDLTSGLLDSVTVDIRRGWNLIGAVGEPINTAAFDDWLMPPVYGYDVASGNYFESTVLLPGRGYWVLSTADTTITILR